MADEIATRTVSRLRESDPYKPVKRFLEDSGYVVRGEVRQCDMVGVTADSIVAVELKLTLGLSVLY